MFGSEGLLVFVCWRMCGGLGPTLGRSVAGNPSSSRPAQLTGRFPRGQWTGSRGSTRPRRLTLLSSSITSTTLTGAWCRSLQASSAHVLPPDTPCAVLRALGGVMAIESASVDGFWAAMIRPLISPAHPHRIESSPVTSLEEFPFLHAVAELTTHAQLLRLGHQCAPLPPSAPSTISFSAQTPAYVTPSVSKT